MKFSPFVDFINLMFPDLCVVCGCVLQKNEHQLCLSCLHDIPKTNYHLMVDNPIEKRFWGKIPVYRATSYFFFQKGSSFQKLLHILKYQGNKEIGELMGRYAAIDLLDSPDFTSIDLIIPVPLHPKKYKSRGYNQSEWIGKGMCTILNKPLDTSTLIRIRENATQTKKSVFERYENTEGIFAINDKMILEGKHILLVDDVLTTGSTLEACARALLETPGIRISIFTLAVA
ncbi:MAG: ComF family protein [Bacteroidota bacterium]|nr:ComF family protein [Bacteroidota bacterium]